MSQRVVKSKLSVIGAHKAVFMGYPSIRYAVLEQLASADLTVTALAERIGSIRNSVAKSIEQTHEHGVVHIAGWDKRLPIYRRGPGLDEPRPPAEVLKAPEDKPAAPVVPVLYQGIEYFEMADLLPGVRHFMCTKLKSTLSVESCADRYRKANADAPESDRYFTCRNCPIGAAHGGHTAPNTHKFRGMTICGRCHRGSTRLIGRHLCISCYNRSRELVLGRNAKGTAPVNLASLEQRSITYRAGDVVKTRVLDKTLDMEELVIAVFRDEANMVTFGFKNTAMDWLLDDEFDRSISDTPDDIFVTPEPVTENAAVAAPIARDEAMHVEHVVKPATAGFDPYARIREVIEKEDREVRVHSPGISRRAAKKARLRARRQVRVSDMTVGLLRNVEALPAPAPAPVPVWKPDVDILNLFSGAFSPV